MGTFPSFGILLTPACAAFISDEVRTVGFFVAVYVGASASSIAKVGVGVVVAGGVVVPAAVVVPAVVVAAVVVAALVVGVAIPQNHVHFHLRHQ